MPDPRFRITKGKGAEYHFNLTAANGQIILQSQRYASHSGATSGVASVKEHANDDTRFEERDANDGSLYFVLIAKNGEIVGTSEMYSSAGAREAGIESVRVNALAAGVEGSPAPIICGMLACQTTELSSFAAADILQLAAPGAQPPLGLL